MIFDRNKVISKKLKSELNLKYRKGVRSKSSRSIISAGGGGGYADLLSILPDVIF